MAVMTSRILSLILGSAGFLAAYVLLAFLGNQVLVMRIVAQGDTDHFEKVLYLSIASVAAAIGGAIAGGLDRDRWRSGALVVGGVAASYFFLLYRSAGARVPYLAVLMGVAASASIAGAWLYRRLQTRER